VTLPSRRDSVRRASFLTLFVTVMRSSNEGRKGLDFYILSPALETSGEPSPCLLQQKVKFDFGNVAVKGRMSLVHTTVKFG
jgi:hypothetical protein